MSNTSLIKHLLIIKDYSTKDFDRQLAGAYIKDVNEGKFRESDVLVFISKAQQFIKLE